MIVGAVVWCTIWVNMDLGEGKKTYETAAKGRVTKINPDIVTVDFSRYAREQGYLGDKYYDITVQKDECVSD